MATTEIDFPNPAEVNPFTDINGYTWDYNGVTWIRRTQGLVAEAPIDGSEYARLDGDWSIVSHPAAEVPEAPNVVGKIYARGELQWNEVTDPAAGVTDAPSDGTIYGRKDAVWANIQVADIPDIQAALDLKSDIGHVHPIDEITDIGGSPITLIPEAPINGKKYVRQDGAWIEETNPVITLISTEALTFMYPQEEDDATLFYATKSVEIGQIFAHVSGAGTTESVTMNVCFSGTRNGTPTKVFNTDVVVTDKGGIELTGMNNTSIPINNWIWVEIFTVIGDPLMLNVTVDYQKA